MFDTIKPLPLVSKMLRLCTITDRVTESLLKHTKEQRQYIKKFIVIDFKMKYFTEYTVCDENRG